jgi:hypothetical protein
MVGSWWRLGGMLGIAFVVVWLLKMVGTGVTPPYDDPIGEIREYWEDDGRRYLVVQYASLLAMVIFLLPYMVALTTLLGRAERGARLWSRVSLAGGVCFVAVTIADNSIWTSLALGADSISDDGMRTLMYLDAAAFYIGVFPLAVFVTAGSLVIAATGVMRAWLGYVGLADGIALFAAPLVVLEEHSESPLGLFYFLAIVVGAAWVVATGVTMLRLREEPRALPDPAATEGAVRTG